MPIAIMSNGIQFPREVPLAIELNGLNYAVTLLTPSDIEAFIHGFLFSESVIDNTYDVHEIDIFEHKFGQVAHCTIANRCIAQLDIQKRTRRATSSCGLCGVASLDNLFPEPCNNSSAPSRYLDEASLFGIRKRLSDYQSIGRQSGALHAAFWLDGNLNISNVKEDIGRHNAMDKLIGDMRMKKQDFSEGAMLLTSRCGVELILKAIRANIGTLITLASPSDLAIRVAEKHDLRLIHIPQRDKPRTITTGNRT